MTTDPNVLAARVAGRRSELGGMEVEFIMYGCAYLQNGKMHYKVSSQAEDIYRFAESAAVNNIYTSNVLKFTEKCCVPSGMHDLIATDVKKDLARELQKRYSAEFFYVLMDLAERMQSNSAAKLLWNEAEQLEGVFSEEKLNRYEVLVQYVYRHHGIDGATYHSIMKWVQEERKNMDDNLVSKDFYEKTVYGFAYEKNGQIKFVDNVLLSYVYEKAEQLEMEGYLITPILKHTYWHNKARRTSDVLQEFRALLTETYDTDYMQQLKEIRNNGVDVNTEEYIALLEEIKNKYSESAWKTAVRYAHSWSRRV